MAAPSPAEYKLLETFRYNVRDLPLDEEQSENMFLLSWIRARENDLNKAEDMLRKYLDWRKKEDMENIFNWLPPDSYATMFPCHISGLDKDGRPVVYLPLGIWDIRKVVERGERQVYIRFVDQLFAGFIHAVRQAKTSTGGRHTQFVIILDMNELSVRQFTSRSTIDTILETFRRFEANYPETLFLAFVINAPAIFPVAFKLVKPLLSQRTRQKIQIYNSNTSKWKPILSQYVPESSFPSALLGSSDSEIDGNGNVPDGKTIERRIEAGGKLDVTVSVTTSNSILTWGFETVDYDIGFSILHDTGAVVAYKRFDSHIAKAIGTIECKNQGKYILVFDNSYSRFRPKTVRFHYSISSE